MRMYTKLQITSLSAALLLAASPVALAQTANDPATTPGTTVPETTAPSSTTDATGTATAVDPSSSLGASADFMDQSDVEEDLEDRGYSEIDLQLEDNRYVGTATWYDEQVELVVNARNGRVIAPTTLTAEQVAYKLEQEDYQNVSDVQEAGSEFTARAERFGEEIDLRVSASSGNVIDPRELTRDQLRERLEEDDYSNVVIFDRRDDYGN